LDFGFAARNPDFLGAAVPKPPISSNNFLYVDYSGRPFTLQSLFPVGVDPGEFSRFLNIRVQSSKGGDVVLTFPVLTAFVGPEWTEIDWLLFVTAFDPGAPDFGIDHITFAVPAAVSEPATLPLLLISLLMWVYMRVKPRAQRAPLHLSC
jgi:hypothetical protein